jgi:hypothetical protein
MTNVVISQPMLFPWPGFFELVASADIFVHLDDAQFSRGGFMNRIQLKYPSGMKWMTIPLTGSGTYQRIYDLVAAGSDWKKRHREMILQSFCGASHLDLALQLFDRVYARESVVDLLSASIEETAQTIGLARPQLWLAASDLGIEGKASQRLLSIIRSIGGSRYITAHGAANYLEHEAFERAGISVEYIDYSLTPYAQQHGQFTPYVSILDFVANCGLDAGAVIVPKTVPWKNFLANKRSIWS